MPCLAAYMMQCPHVMCEDDLRLAFGLVFPPAHAPAGRMHACRAPYLEVWARVGGLAFSIVCIFIQTHFGGCIATERVIDLCA